MAIPVATINALYLGFKDQEKDEDKNIPAMRVLELKTDVYVSEIGTEVSYAENPKESGNYSHYILHTDREQMALTPNLVPNTPYALRVAVSAKGQGNGARAKFKLLDVEAIG